MKNNNRQTGSALIITMLVVVAISVAAFGLSQIFLADVRIAASIEDSTKAFYSAEAGTEEGLLRYRVDRNNNNLNDNSAIPARTILDGQYTLLTSYTNAGIVSTIIENNEGNGDFPNGDVAQDQTFEIPTIPNSTGTITISWTWLGSPPPYNPDRQCGVELTDIFRDGGFHKEIFPSPGTNGSSVDTGARQAVRIKPLCGSLDSLQLTVDSGVRIGRTIQIIDSTGTSGRAKRRLRTVLNRRSGSLIGIFDFVLGSEGDICQPVGSC